MKKIIGMVASFVLFASLVSYSVPVAQAANGFCGPLGAHYATKTNFDSQCYQIRARLSAYDILTKKTTYYYGMWVISGTSISVPPGPSSFPSYTTLTDSFDKKSDNT